MAYSDLLIHLLYYYYLGHIFPFLFDWLFSHSSLWFTRNDSLFLLGDHALPIIALSPSLAFQSGRKNDGDFRCCIYQTNTFLGQLPVTALKNNKTCLAASVTFKHTHTNTRQKEYVKMFQTTIILCFVEPIWAERRSKESRIHDFRPATTLSGCMNPTAILHEAKLGAGVSLFVAFYLGEKELFLEQFLI